MVSVISNDKSFKDLGKIVGYVDVKHKHRTGKKKVDFFFIGMLLISDKSRIQYSRDRPSLGDVLDALSSAMNLLRRCRVNAALTIQLFSQLFHFINMWLFNILVQEEHQLCMRVWGIRLKRRLGSVEAWAEKQGLELAADCHLCRIIQVSL